MSTRDILIEGLIEYADYNADFMEGTELPEFKIYENQMCWAVELLKKAGVDYNPMTGKRRLIPH